MRKLTQLLVLLLICGASSMAQDRTIDHLRDVRIIYVDKLGESDDANLIREKIINRLLESKTIVVTDDKAKADAVLAGAVTVSSSFRAVNGTGRTKHYADFAMRLVTSDKRILWTKAGDSAADSADEAIIKDLFKAIKKDQKDK
jgi:hypothetical protein